MTNFNLNVQGGFWSKWSYKKMAKKLKSAKITAFQNAQEIENQIKTLEVTLKYDINSYS